MENQNQWTLVVQRKPRRVKTETSYKNPETEVIINKNHRRKDQTKDLSKKRHLSRLHNSNNDLKREFV